MRPVASFNDRIHRLFVTDMDAMRVGGKHVYDVTIQVTEDCNLRCTYCYQHNKTSHKLDAETGKKFIDLLLASDDRSKKYIQSRESAGVILDFIGGEPFLEIDLISELTDYFIQQMIELHHPWATRYRINICTNGTLYFDPRVQAYIKKHLGHLNLSITVDGDKKLHDSCRVFSNGKGSYDLANAAVQDYKTRFHGYPGTKLTIAPGNIDYLSNALIHYIENGAGDINANCVYEEGWSVEDATTLYYELKKVSDYILKKDLENECYISILDWDAGTESNHDEDMPWCGGSGLMIGLDTYGDIYPCLRYMPSSVGYDHPLLKIGNVDAGFVINEEQEHILQCFKCVTRHSQLAGTKCETCKISTGCGDCAAYSYETTGKIGTRTTYHCDMHKARVLAQVYYWNKAYKKNGSKKPRQMICPEEWAIPLIGEAEYKELCNLSEGG